MRFRKNLELTTDDAFVEYGREKISGIMEQPGWRTAWR